MLFPFLLGFLSSFGHCVGMCSGVALILSRRAQLARTPADAGRKGSAARGLIPAHAGRVITYSLLGLAAGGIGEGAGRGLPVQFLQAQGGIALATACLAAYLALALLGSLPSPERLFAGLARSWGRAMQRLQTPAPRSRLFPSSQAFPSAPLHLFALGLLWGLLPCGLVFSALLMAAASGSALQGALSMAAFGMGTWPALLGVHWLGGWARRAVWPRAAGALVMLAFGTQMALRGLAAWGVIGHYHIHSLGLVLW